MNVLFVSIAFPPKGDPESLQVLKYYTSLKKKSDLNFSIITSKNPTLFMEPNADLKPFLSGYKELIELPIRENKYINFVKRKIKTNSLNYPDSKFSFHKQTQFALSKIKHIPDVVYSRSFPLSSTILAYKLVEHYNKPWVLHLSDPWIFKSKNDNDLENSEVWNIEWEEKCFQKAAVISLTSNKTIAFYKKKYPQFSEKFQFFPNVYDLSELGPNLNPQNDNRIKTQFLYTGGLTHERNPKFLLECLQELFTEQPDLMISSSFKFIGPKDSYVTNLFKEFSLPFVENKGPVTYFESKEIQKDADILLILDAPITDPNKAVFFPSKLLDYMIIGKPILAISPNFSTTSEVINEYNLGSAFSHSEKSKIKAFILECLNGQKEFSIDPSNLPKDFDVNFNVDRLYNLFLQLHAKS